MRKYYYILSILSALILVGAEDISAENNPQVWKWYSFSEAYPMAIEQGKHLIVNFYSLGCLWCNKLDNETFGNSEILKELSDDFVGARVNIGSNRTVEWKGNLITERELARLFFVRGTPYLAFVDTTGTVIATVPGYVPPDKFAPMLKYIGGYWYKEFTYQEFLASEEALKKKRNEE